MDFSQTVQTEADLWGTNQSAAVFTFDLDAEQLWRAEGNRDSDFERLSFRGKYGPDVGVPRILTLFEKYDCQCTFFVPGKVAEEWPTTIQQIHDMGHEIAHHTYSHEHPRHMDPEREEKEFKKTIDIIEDLTGEPPLGYRGGHSQRTLHLAEESGMRYDSSRQDTDVPYHHQKADLVELPNSFLLDDFVYWGYNMQPVFPYQSGISPNGPVFETWQQEFDGLHRRGRMFMLTMHPQVIGRAGRIDALEGLLQHVVETEDAWVTTCASAAEEWAQE